MITITTPESINENVNRLCDEIGTGTQPVYVPVSPERGLSADACFKNVQAKVKKDGGSLQHGWIIWEAPEKLIEAEFHAVWVSPEGELIDITPKPDGETQILFVPDNKRVYENEPVDNFRLALSDDPEVQRIMQQSEQMFALRQKYNQNGEVKIPARELKKLNSQFVEQRVAPPTVGRNDPCSCGSGKKFKKCCANK